MCEGGDRKGKPVFCLHGTPGCGTPYRPHLLDASKRGIRLIGYSRPGYGKSSPAPGRRVADAAQDVLEIADSLGLDRFAVWGISGGGPHAVACAALLPSRIVASASLASPAPYRSDRKQDWFEGMGEDNITEFHAAMSGPARLRRFIEPAREQLLKATPEDVLKVFQTLLSPVDRDVLTGELLDYLAKLSVEGLRSGPAGWIDDDFAFVRPWGFRLRARSPLLLWHGTLDRFVPSAHGQWLAAHLPNAETHLSEVDGHLTLFERRVPETHAWLLKHF